MDACFHYHSSRGGKNYDIFMQENALKWMLFTVSFQKWPFSVLFWKSGRFFWPWYRFFSRFSHSNRAILVHSIAGKIVKRQIFGGASRRICNNDFMYVCFAARRLKKLYHNVLLALDLRKNNFRSWECQSDRNHNQFN